MSVKNSVWVEEDTDGNMWPINQICSFARSIEKCEIKIDTWRKDTDTWNTFWYLDRKFQFPVPGRTELESEIYHSLETKCSTWLCANRTFSSHINILCTRTVCVLAETYSYDRHITFKIAPPHSMTLIPPSIPQFAFCLFPSAAGIFINMFLQKAV
jgi:hypothetical protein